MRFDAVPDSSLPEDLRALGYVVTPAGTTQRIVPHAITVGIAADRSGIPPLPRETKLYELTLPPGVKA